MNLFKQTCLGLLISISICLTFQTSAFAVPKAVKAKSEYMLAEQMYNEGKFKDCIKHAVIAKDTLGKSNSRIENLLTKAYYKNNQINQAMTSVDLFFELTPESESGTKQYNEMVELYSKIDLAKKKNKKRAQIFYEQGKKLKYSNSKNALPFFNEAINIDPEHIQTYVTRSEIYYWDLKKYDKAIQDYNKLMELIPDSSYPYAYAAWLYAVCPDKSYRDGAKAIELALKSLSIKESSSVRKTLAAAYVENKEFEKAIQTYKGLAINDQKVLKRYQKSLKEKGFYSREVDGVVNPELIDAIRKCVMQGMYI